MAFIKGFFGVFKKVFIELYTFIKDHFTDKSGFWDEKRTTAFGLLVLAVVYGVFPSALGVAHPDTSIFGGLLAAAVTQYFSSAYNDGRNPPNVQVNYNGSQ